MLTKSYTCVVVALVLTLTYSTVASVGPSYLTDYLKLNVGGQYYFTSRKTLTKKISKPYAPAEYYESNFFHKFNILINPDLVRDFDGFFFFDTSPKYFNYILDYVRKANTNAQFFLPNQTEDLLGLLGDAEFFNLHGLKEIIELILRFDSKILNNQHKQELMKIGKLSFGNKWKLLYRGSRDGFKSENFASRCESIPKTLTVVKSKNGNIFGGYTDLDWSKTQSLKTDQNAFIFSLINHDNTPIRISYNKNGASTYSSPNHGPGFGGGSDLHISSNSNSSFDSYSNLGRSYSHPKYAFESKQAKNFLAGSNYFQVEDIEVFALVEPY
jgi:hypothetical protein